MKAATDLVSCVLVGTIMGVYLDKWLHSSPLCLIICILLGSAAGFKAIMKK
jgi:F0F1-type ATP synthase assembly protein I